MAPSPYFFNISICPVDMYARFDEIPFMTLKVIKKTKCNGWTDGQTDRWTDNVKTVYPPTNTGGYNKQTIREAKTKALFSFAVKLICVFVFAYAKSRFSHNEAHFRVMTAIFCVSKNL